MAGPSRNVKAGRARRPDAERYCQDAISHDSYTHTHTRHAIFANLPRRAAFANDAGRAVHRFLLLAAGIVVIVLAGCSETKTSDRDLVLMNVDEARELAAGGAGLRLGRARRVAWVDPRSESEFRAERIAGAIHLPLERARDDHRSLREYDVLIVYGNDFNSPRATALSKTLIELRHGDVRTLRGGLRAWKEAGHSVESGTE